MVGKDFLPRGSGNPMLDVTIADQLALKEDCIFLTIGMIYDVNSLICRDCYPTPSCPAASQN